ncbi:MAG: aminotransferase class IV [Planctomycetota bacterium]|jgi:branched-subunit amino acid aminotransferase/4-amino-4-deoxychorismate lyase
MQVWLNGEFLERDAARLSVFDAGLQHGVGLFETMSARHGRVFRVDAHVRQLAESARALLLSERLRPDPLAEAVARTVERNGLAESRVRLTVTGGDLNPLPAAGNGRGRVDPTVLVVAQPPTAYPDAFFEQGIVAAVADGRDNPLDPMAGHKTLNYWPRIRALQAAAARGAGEALWFTVTNHLSAGSVSNAFLVRDGRLLTPYARGEEEDGALAAPVRPGITRAAILEAATRLGLETERRMLDVEAVLGADEIFLTNSSWGVLPVVRVERQAIGDGEVGSITLDLRAAWMEMVDRETSGEDSGNPGQLPVS